MSLAPQAEECQQTVDDEIALDSTFLLRKVVHKAQVTLKGIHFFISITDAWTFRHQSQGAGELFLFY